MTGDPRFGKVGEYRGGTETNNGGRGSIVSNDKASPGSDRFELEDRIADGTGRESEEGTQCESMFVMQ